MGRYTIGLDYGTNSVRSIIVDTASGAEAATAVYNYEHGSAGIILGKDPNVARQHPADYLKGAEVVIRGALKSAARDVKGFTPSQVMGIGVDTTGSTPIPVDRQGNALAMSKKYKNNPAAMAWLWKDHTSSAEAAEITALAKKIRPHYLEKCGGTYSSEWFWSKLLHCLRTAPDVFNSAYTWVECADWVPAMLTGNQLPERMKVGVCAAGHKAMFCSEWGGYPDEKFLGRLDPRLAPLRKRLAATAFNVSDCAGRLTGEWAQKTGLTAGIPVCVGAFDAHLGGVGAGIGPGTLVKIIGTSTCDCAVTPSKRKINTIPGICGIVNGSILPGFWGIEAGQSAVGDIFKWWVEVVCEGQASLHNELSAKADKLKPGQSGLLALDWNNGNRTILVDPMLTGLMLGYTLHTKREEIYRALIEATAFGAKAIIERMKEYGVVVNRIVCAGGIADKSPMLMQIYADVTGCVLEVSASNQTCALGSAVAASVVAGVHKDFKTAISKMVRPGKKKYRPDTENSRVYGRLYRLYMDIHDAFGGVNTKADLSKVMKELIKIRNEAGGL